MNVRCVPVLAVALASIVAACDGGSGTAGGDRASGPMPRFVESAAAAGLTRPQSTRRTGSDCLLAPDRVRAALPALAGTLMGSAGDQCLPERQSGGAAVADVDGDGHLDLYLTNLDGPGRLYRNRGDGTFTDATAGSGLDTLPAGSNGAAFGDVDNDGRPDLAVTMIGTPRTYFFHGLGEGRFEEDATTRGLALDDGRIHTGFTPTFGDYDGDGWLDLYETEWSSVEWTVGVPRSHQRLFRNLGAEGRPGQFEDVTDRVGVAVEQPVVPVFGFGARLVDLDDDGRQDLVLSSDFHSSRVFWNDGDHFTDGTREAGLGTDENGMGLAVGDVDGDGRPDLFVTSISARVPPCPGRTACPFGISGNRLFRNLGNRRFADVTDRAGVRDGGWGWGAGFLDAANRGVTDLVMTGGVRYPASPSTRDFERGLLRLWRGDGQGHFTDVASASGLRSDGPGKGVVVFDADGDGRQDVLVVRDGATPQLFRNRTADAGHWLDVRAVGRGSNRDGVGAVVTVRAPGRRPVTAEIGSVTGFLGQSPYVVHAGLGDATRATVSVRFPATGRTVTVPVRRVDRAVVVTEPAS